MEAFKKDIGLFYNMKPAFVRRVDGDQYLFNILITAIATVLLTRLYLDLAGYPTIGGDFLHLAHVLWGGVFMILAAILAVSFHGKITRVWSSILAGIGFGLFIDEVGKFITHDNNYFFEPAIVIMYLCFIGIFLIYNWTKNKKVTSPKGLLYNALELLEEVIEKDFQKHEKERMIHDLNQVIKSKEEPYSSIAKKIKAMIKPMKTLEKKQNKWEKIWDRAKNLHKYFGRRPVFAGMTILLAINGIASIINGIVTIFSVFLRREDLLQQIGVENLNNPTVYALGISLLSALISAFLVIKGIYWLLKKQRMRALHLFRVGLLIRILVTHLFTFYYEQFGATLSVSLDILFYFAVEFLLKEVPEDLNKK